MSEKAVTGFSEQDQRFNQPASAEVKQAISTAVAEKIKLPRFVKPTLTNKDLSIYDDCLFGFGGHQQGLVYLMNRSAGDDNSLPEQLITSVYHHQLLDENSGQGVLKTYDLTESATGERQLYRQSLPTAPLGLEQRVSWFGRRDRLIEPFFSYVSNCNGLLQLVRQHVQDRAVIDSDKRAELGLGIASEAEAQQALSWLPQTYHMTDNVLAHHIQQRAQS